MRVKKPSATAVAQRSHGRDEVSKRVARAQAKVAEPNLPAICDETVGPLYERIRASYPLSRFGLGMHENTNGERWLVISMIEVESAHRSHGVGSDVMEDIVSVADKNGWTLALTPSAKVAGYDPNRLAQWYGRFGFAPSDPFDNYLFMCEESMIRRPNV